MRIIRFRYMSSRYFFFFKIFFFNLINYFLIYPTSSENSKRTYRLGEVVFLKASRMRVVYNTIAYGLKWSRLISNQ